MSPQLVSAALLGAATTLCAPAYAQSGGAGAIDSCLSAADRGQVLRDKGSLLAARTAFQQCALEVCPQVVKTECLGWRTQVDGAIPSIIPAARDEQGRDLIKVRVSIDGAQVLDSIDGKPQELDPGPHTVRFEDGQGRSAEMSVVLLQGEKRRPLRAVLTASGSAPNHSGAFEVPAVSWVLGGIGVAGLITFGALAGIAKSDRDELQGSCAPHCDSADVDAIRSKLIGANTMLGVGLVSLATAGVLTFALQPDEETDLALTVGPTGALLSVGF